MYLKCLNCGEGVEIEEVYDPWVSDPRYVISCRGGWGCGAEWDRFGDMITEGRKQDA